MLAIPAGASKTPAVAVNPLGAVAYDEARKAVEGQAATLDSVQTRAGTLLAAAALVSSFLGGQALGQPTVSNGHIVKTTVGLLGWLAIGTFVGVAALALAVLWPREWRFDMAAAPILDATRGTGINADDGRAQLAIYWDENYVSNKVTLDNVFWCYRGACVLLVVEAVFWILDLN